MSSPSSSLRHFLRTLDVWSFFIPAAGILSFLLVANLAFWFLLTRPRLDLAAGSRASLQRSERELSTARRKVENVRDRLSEARCARDDLETFRDDILASKHSRMTRVMGSIRELARTFRMDPENISYDVQALEDEQLVHFSINFPLRGSYEDLRQFILHIENSEHFLLIQQIGLRGSPDGGASVLNLSIRLHTYFALTDSEAPTTLAEASRIVVGSADRSR